MTSASSHPSVADRLDAYLAAVDLEAVWFGRPNDFAWVTGGADNVVDGDADVGVAAAGYDGDSLTVVTDSIEATRLVEEELDRDGSSDRGAPIDGGVAVESFPWYESGLAAAVAERSPRPAAADFDVPELSRFDARGLRQPLTDEQVAAYGDVATDAAAALESALREASGEESERAVAAAIRRELADRDLAAPVVLVGGAERAQSYRHYTPTGATLGEYALASVTARRDGLYASCTRTVAFDPPSWLRDRTRDAARVEATALSVTRHHAANSGTAGDVFAAIRAAYAELGWEGEWREHHQGGAAGYAGREWIATPDHGAPVEAPMGYAWNPTVQGAKSEDLHLVDGGGVDTLTITGEWPTVEVTPLDVDGADPDRTFERHGVLPA